MEDDSDKGLRGLLKSLLKKRTIDDSSDLAEGLQDLMDEGQAKGFMTDEESEMVHGVLELKETRIHSILIPRTEISSASINSTLGEVIELVNDCGHTRIPIYKNSIDEVAGILHAKDLLKLWGEDSSALLPAWILRKPYLVPENQRVSELLREMKAKKTHLAIVTDEYGGTSGIITIEDILEEIVGEILDEHDNEEPLLNVIDAQTLLVDARLKIEKLVEHLRISLPAGDFESVGGFIIYLLGRIPGIAEKIRHGDLEFTIQSANQRKIDKVLIKHNPTPEPAQEPSQSAPHDNQNKPNPPG